MDKRVLIICRGIQGSGKTSFAKQWCHEDPEHRVRFNNDDIRNMLGDYWVPNREKLVTDEPITPVIELIRNFCDNYPAKLIILTGREDTPEVRKATEQWLENNWLHPDILLMRPAKSFTAGPMCKKKLYEDNIKGKFYIPFVLEDNCKCVEMWRNEGLICLQPNEGKF